MMSRNRAETYPVGPGRWARWITATAGLAAMAAVIWVAQACAEDNSPDLGNADVRTGEGAVADDAVADDVSEAAVSDDAAAAVADPDYHPAPAQYFPDSESRLREQIRTAQRGPKFEANSSGVSTASGATGGSVARADDARPVVMRAVDAAGIEARDGVLAIAGLLGLGVLLWGMRVQIGERRLAAGRVASSRPIASRSPAATAASTAHPADDPDGAAGPAFTRDSADAPAEHRRFRGLKIRRAAPTPPAPAALPFDPLLLARKDWILRSALEGVRSSHGGAQVTRTAPAAARASATARSTAAPSLRSPSVSASEAMDTSAALRATAAPELEAARMAPAAAPPVELESMFGDVLHTLEAIAGRLQRLESQVRPPDGDGAPPATANRAQRTATLEEEDAAPPRRRRRARRRTDPSPRDGVAGDLQRDRRSGEHRASAHRARAHRTAAPHADHALDPAAGWALDPAADWASVPANDSTTGPGAGRAVRNAPARRDGSTGAATHLASVEHSVDEPQAVERSLDPPDSGLPHTLSRLLDITGPGDETVRELPSQRAVRERLQAITSTRERVLYMASLGWDEDRICQEANVSLQEVALILKSLFRMDGKSH